MSTTIRFADLFARLADWIPADQVRFREGADGGHYVKAPTVMNRLDDVLGVDSWWDDYQIIDELTVECSLTIRLPDGSTVTKKDVGIRKPAKDGKIDPGCSWKAAYSDARKRAAVKFGVARHLCKCGFPAFVGATLGGPSTMTIEGPTTEPSPPAPKVHDPGPPGKTRGAWGNGPAKSPKGMGNGLGGPTTGSKLFGWLKDQEKANGAGLLRYVDQWAKLQGFPRMMKDFSADEVGLAFQEACRKLGTTSAPADRGDAYEEALAN